MKIRLGDIVFAVTGILAVTFFAFQIYFSTIRDLTALEASFFSLFGLLFSIAASWYFSRRYSEKNPNQYEFLVSRYERVLDGECLIGLRTIEPSLRKGTTTLDALEEMKYGFDFLGIAGGKFVPELFNEKNHLCRFIAGNPHNSIRLLLMDPDCKQIDTWAANPDKADEIRIDITSSLKLLSQQIKLGRKIQVKLYNYFPPIRLQIVDNKTIYICEYNPADDGWDSPQLIFESNAKRPFTKPLNAYFELLWSQGEELNIDKYLN